MTAQAMKKETLAFEAGSNYLNTITMRQSGSIPKGLIELYQNGCDSKATRIDIDVSVNGFKVTDNGFGFVDETHVDDYFAVVAFDHDKGIHADDERYSEFGLGRFQLAGFASIDWRSNEFNMAVDFADGQGAGFDKTVGLEKISGCEVSGKWYKKLKPSDVDGILHTLKYRLAFGGVDLYLNGTKVQKNDVKWDVETDDYCLLFTEMDKPVEVYNRGVWVASLDHKDKFGAVLLSKAKLKLNTARDMVLVSKCPVWKSAAKVLSDKAANLLHLRDPKSFNKKNYHLFLNALFSGKFNDLPDAKWATGRYSEWIDKFKVIPTPRGLATIERLLDSRTVALFDKKIHDNGLASSCSYSQFLIDPAVLAATNMPSLEAFVEKLKSALSMVKYDKRASSYVDSRLTVVTEKEMAAELQKNYEHKLWRQKRNAPPFSSQKAMSGINALKHAVGVRFAVASEDPCISYSFNSRVHMPTMNVSEQCVEDIVDGGYEAYFQNLANGLEVAFNADQGIETSRIESHKFAMLKCKTRGSDGVIESLYADMSSGKRYKVAS